VFWDQQVPAGVDWDTWIRQHLASCKCAMVFWSSASITSRNVRHEATIADQEGKLIPVLLEPLNARQFPMGLYAQQAANLADWNGDLNHEEWDKLRREYESKMMPPWVRQRMDEKDAELVAERARRQGAERRDKTLQTQIAKEAETQQELKRERDGALDEIAALKTTAEELTRARSEAEARATDTLHQVAALRATVDEVSRARSDAEQRLSQVGRLKAKETVRSIATVLSPLVLAAAVATVGFWTYQLVSSAPQPSPPVTSDATAGAETKLKAAEADQQQLKQEVQRQTKAAADADAKLKVAVTEQQRLAKAATDADAKRVAAETEQQRLAKAATDADAKRVAAEKEQQTLAEELRKVRAELATKQVALPQATSTAFSIRANTEASGLPVDPVWASGGSRAECEQRCAQIATCVAFAYRRSGGMCYFYSGAVLFKPNQEFDSGERKSASSGR
jgi:hypothetical protein